MKAREPELGYHTENLHIPAPRQIFASEFRREETPGAAGVQETMHTILCDYYQAALRALEKQVKGMQQPRIASQGAPDYPKNPASETLSCVL
jgi:hypothetical protein